MSTAESRLPALGIELGMPAAPVAVGVSSLPFNAAVEVAAVFELRA